MKADGSGILTTAVATGIVSIALLHALSVIKKVSVPRVGLTLLFLFAVVLFIGGQTSALTFTAVSGDCTTRNQLLTFADQLARVSALIIGLNVVARIRFRSLKIGLYVWAVIRFGTAESEVRLILAIGIAATVLVQRDNGVVCLPAPNVATAALGMTLDLMLDIFLLYRTITLLIRGEEDERSNEVVVLISSVALVSWHFVYPSWNHLTSGLDSKFVQDWLGGSSNNAILHIPHFLNLYLSLITMPDDRLPHSIPRSSSNTQLCCLTVLFRQPRTTCICYHCGRHNHQHGPNLRSLLPKRFFRPTNSPRHLQRFQERIHRNQFSRRSSYRPRFRTTSHPLPDLRAISDQRWELQNI